jgi:hypothetical protein
MSTDEPDVSIPAEIELVNLRRLCERFNGDPVDPLFEYEKLESEGITRQQAQAGRHTPMREGRGITARQTRAVVDLTRQKFGSIQAYQVYKIIHEIETAMRARGISVMEVCAKPSGRPAGLTRQYLRYVAHRADGLSLKDIDDALLMLGRLGWTDERGGTLRTRRKLVEERYRFQGRKLRRVRKGTEADICLFVPVGPTNDMKVVGIIDAVVSPQSRPTIIGLKAG